MAALLRYALLHNAGIVPPGGAYAALQGRSGAGLTVASPGLYRRATAQLQLQHLTRKVGRTLHVNVFGKRWLEEYDRNAGAAEV